MFKPGDKVVVIYGDDILNLVKGKTYTIKEIDMHIKLEEIDFGFFKYRFLPLEVYNSPLYKALHEHSPEGDS